MTPKGPAPLIRAARRRDLAAIRAIYNEAVANTTATWDWHKTSATERRAWFEAQHTVLVADVAGAVAGYAAYGPFNKRDGYRHTVENALYVAPPWQGRGIGAGLLGATIAHALHAGRHAMVAEIEASNAASIRLHARAGFVEVGRLPEVGRKFDRWLDLVLMQLVLVSS